jgi:hypothetical protein
MSSVRAAVRGAALGAGGLWKERERPDPDPVRGDHNDAASLQRLLELRQVGLEQFRLIVRAVLPAASVRRARRWLPKTTHFSAANIAAEGSVVSCSSVGTDAVCMGRLRILHASLRAMVSATDESQGAWAKHFGGLSVGCWSHGGVDLAWCEFGWRSRSVSTWFLLEFA